MNPKRIRVALLGAGRIGQEHAGTSDRHLQQSLTAEWDANVIDLRTVKNDAPGKLATPGGLYPALLDEMVTAGYNATEWGMNMERDPAKLRADLQRRNLQILGGSSD